MTTTGDISIGFYGGDLNPWSRESVSVQIIDPFSDTLRVVARGDTNPGTDAVIIKGVPADKGQNYSIIAVANGFRDAAVYPVKARAGAVVISRLILIPRNPIPDFTGLSFNFLNNNSKFFHDALTNGGITEADFLGLDPSTRLVSALNIDAKLRNTTLNGRVAAEFLVSIDEPNDIEPDRIKCMVKPEIVGQIEQEIARNSSFTKVPEWANELFHNGYPVSFKQRIQFGSMQFSFASQPNADGLLMADIDIDLFTDIGHFGEVIRNKITQTTTDPYTVYCQLFDQGIKPFYLLNT